MKKKIISLALVLCVLLVSVIFVGCEDKNNNANNDNNKSTADIINDALKNTQDLDNMDAELKMEMNVAMEGMTMSVPVNAKIKAKGLKSDNIVMLTDMTMSVVGQEVNMQMYNEGEWAYIVVDDMKYKTNVKEEIGEYDYSEDINDIIKSLPDDLLAEVEAEKGSDSSTTVTVSIPDDKFQQIYDDFLEGVNEDSGSLGGDVKISNAVVKITVLNGYVTVYDMQFTMDVTSEEMSMKVDVKAAVTYNNPGQDVTITAPEGYEDFEELSMGDYDEL